MTRSALKRSQGQECWCLYVYWSSCDFCVSAYSFWNCKQNQHCSLLLPLNHKQIFLGSIDWNQQMKRNSLIDEILSLVAGNSVYFGEIIEFVDVHCTWKNRQHPFVCTAVPCPYALSWKELLSIYRSWSVSTYAVMFPNVLIMYSLPSTAGCCWLTRKPRHVS